MKQIEYNGTLYAVGDKVRIERKVDTQDPDGMGAGKPWTNQWVENMDEYLGREGTLAIVTSVGVRINIDGRTGYSFPLKALVNLSRQPKTVPFKLEVFQRVTTRNGWKFIVCSHPALLEGNSPHKPLYLLREGRQYAYINFPGECEPGYEMWEVVEVHAAPEFIEELFMIEKVGKTLWHENQDVERAERANKLRTLYSQRADLDTRIQQVENE